ncbi:class I SAM-dependent methyltransferase [Kitasatospora purpeofusca]|uniref:class I SAM-dependent methyltransferase n=1 Tax=Kitasatospora purpeofusca TaxID=67352 RepID=UPI0035D80876
MLAPPTTLSSKEAALQRGYNALHAARSSSDVVARLYALAMGDAYPAEIAPASSCDWPLMALLVNRLRLQPGQQLVDLACGTGGTGLWMARALTVRLTGIDISSTAIDLARARREAFVAPDAARFAVATFQATGLPDAHAHAVVCIDAFSHATDRSGALTEVHRILRPGGRAVLTHALRRESEPGWTEAVQRAGLVIDHVEERPDEPRMWARLYRLWQDHEGELRRALGDEQAENMLAEAARTLPTLDRRRALALTLRRPAGREGPAPRPAGEPAASR